MAQQDQTLNTTPLKAKHDAEAKKKFLGKTVEHIDVTKTPQIVQVVEAMGHMAFSSRERTPNDALIFPFGKGT